MAPDRSKAGGNRNRPDILTDPRAIQRVHLDHHQISSHQNVVKTIKDTPITDLADVEVDKTSDDFAAGQSLVWGGDSWIAGDPEVLIPVKAAEEMTKGTPVYVSGEQPSGKPIVSKADSDGTGTYPAIGLLLTDLAAGAEGHAVGGGIISGLDTSSYTVGDALYLSSSPGVLTSTRPTATNEKVQKVAVVARSHAEAGTVIVMGAGRTNDVPNELTTLTGVPLGDSDLGTFNATIYGVRIPDNSDNKEAFQYLSTTLDAAYEEARQATNGVSGLDADLQALVTYHDRYATEAETTRSGATETVEVYYTARPDGDGLAESEVTTSTPAGFVIERKLYFSDKFNADPDTASDWTLYTTQPADNTAFATAKASLLAGLSDTDGTANTRGTLPVSLKMTHRFSQDLLLEDFPGAAAAYSLRKISTDYTGSAIRIREDGTNTETDIGFDSNGDLDTAAIATHCGSNNGFVVTWYDQSGNSNDVTQSTQARQPQVYNGSAVITRNGKPTILFSTVSSTAQGLQGTDLSASNRSRTIFSVASLEVAGAAANIAGRALASTYQYWSTIGASRFVTSANRTSARYDAFTTVAETVGLQVVRTDIANTTNVQIYKDGTQVDSRADNNADWSQTPWGLGGLPALGGGGSNHSTSELIMYESDQSANRTDIEADISAYWTANKRVLDSYPGATFGGAVRRLDNDYTGSCMRIRRSSDNTEQDIGFDSSGNLDTAAIETFCTTSTGWVTKLYDQSGSGNDAYQTVTSLQPQIYDGSQVIRQNGYAALRATTSSTYLRFASVIISGTSARSMLVVANPDSAVNDNLVGLSSSGSGTGALWNWTPEVRVRVVGDEQFNNNPMTRPTVGMLTFPSAGDTTDIRFFENGTEATRTGGTLATINTSTSGFSYIHSTLGWMQECLMWTSDQSANQSDIHTDVEGYYQTQVALLDIYSGASAAYSVRKLSQSYSGSCMRIREDSGNTETDIGFDGDGNLDTAAIASHCGSANGYVVTWYDQSGNSNDVTQATTTRQPQIYNGSAVITRNGKPAVHFFESASTPTGLGGVTLTVSNRSRTIFSVQSLELTGSSGYAHVLGAGMLSRYDYFSAASGFGLYTQNYRTAGRVDVANYVAETAGAQILKVDVANTTNAQSYKNGTQLASVTDNDSNWSYNQWGLGAMPNFPAHASGSTLAEVVLYESDQLTNRIGIESHINTYFSIY